MHKAEKKTELWHQVLTVPTHLRSSARHLDERESQVGEIGWAAMRRLMVEPWEQSDELVVEQHRQA